MQNTHSQMNEPGPIIKKQNKRRIHFPPPGEMGLARMLQKDIFFLKKELVFQKLSTHRLFSYQGPEHKYY